MSYDSSAYPYDTIVYMTDMIGGVSYQASGVLIAPNEVLTAAHFVYSSGVGSASDIVVSPGYDLGYAPYGSVTGTRIHYEQVNDAGGMITPQQSQYDYAVIHLSQSFDLGTMGLLANWAGGAANVTGYPAAAGSQVSNYQYFARSPFYSVYQGMPLGPGSSGGPVWIDGTNGPAVVGLVSSATSSSGIFAQISTSAFNTIESWVAADQAACFASGTRIATLRGAVPVEHLRTDDVAITWCAGRTPIAWIGHRRIACRRHTDPARVWPVRVTRHAFGHGRPSRDLLLSPDHAVFVAGSLVPVRYLVNGATIAQEPADDVTYWHVELPRHDVIFAEGLAVESYLDTGNRACFDNGGPSLVLHPDFGAHRWRTAACADLLREGPRLVAIRRRLHARARALGHTLTARPDVKLRVDGREVAAEIEGRSWRLRVPPGGAQLCLTSRTWVPAYSRPAECDTRRLGVAIGRLWLDGRAIGLDSTRLDRGWHAPEAQWRWTDGDALLPLDGARCVMFELAMTGDYWCPAESPRPGPAPDQSSQRAIKNPKLACFPSG